VRLDDTFAIPHLFPGPKSRKKPRRTVIKRPHLSAVNF
jgi:hypothetical protein